MIDSLLTQNVDIIRLDEGGFQPFTMNHETHSVIVQNNGKILYVDEEGQYETITMMKTNVSEQETMIMHLLMSVDDNDLQQSRLVKQVLPYALSTRLMYYPVYFLLVRPQEVSLQSLTMEMFTKMMQTCDATMVSHIENIKDNDLVFNHHLLTLYYDQTLHNHNLADLDFDDDASFTQSTMTTYRCDQSIQMKEEEEELDQPLFEDQDMIEHDGDEDDVPDDDEEMDSTLSE